MPAAESIAALADKARTALEPLADRITLPLFPANLLATPDRLLASLSSTLRAHASRIPRPPPAILDPFDPLFLRALLVVALTPVIWNILARAEYRTRAISRICRGKYRGAFALAVWIFSFSLFRDAVVVAAQQSQPKSPFLASPACQALAGALIFIGGVLVAAAYARLGVTGTYLGDYFGILMDNRITGFPFNVTDHPMYDGASMLFLGKAILDQRWAGVVLAAWVYIVYRVASEVEGAFTTQIYAQKELLESKKKR